MTTPSARPGPAERRRPLPRRVAALALALVCGMGFLAVYLVFARTATGQALDDQSFALLYTIVPNGTVPVLTSFARGVVVVVLAALVSPLAVAAVGRRAWRAVAASMLVIATTAVTTTLIRDDVLTRPRLRSEAFPENSMPSTHVSVSCALVVAAVLLWPPPRPWWLGNAAGVVAALAALGNVISQAHRVSDVVASALLVGVVSGLSLTVVGPGRPVGRSAGTAR